LVKINAAEACELLGLPSITGVEEARHAAAAVRERAGADDHRAAVVVTIGEEGMVLIDPDGQAWHGAVSARGDYPVGSGDAFLAGVLTALTADPDATWHEAARLGLGAAAANAEIPGAARLDPTRARELAGQAEICQLPD